MRTNFVSPEWRCPLNRGFPKERSTNGIGLGVLAYMWPHWILQSWSSAWKLTLYNINTTLKEPKRSNLLFLGGRRSFIDPICRSFLHGFAHISKVGFVHPIFSLWDINVTLGLLSSRWHVIWRDSVSVWVHVRASKQSVREFYGRASLFVAPYWRAPKRARQLSTATTPLCFGSFSVVLMSYKLIFPLSKISFAEFSVSTQCIFLLVRSFIDPTFCGIFVCGPLQYKCQFTCGRTLPSLPFSPRGRVQLHVGPLGSIHTLFGAYEEYEIYFFGRGYLIKIADNLPQGVCR